MCLSIPPEERRRLNPIIMRFFVHTKLAGSLLTYLIKNEFNADPPRIGLASRLFDTDNSVAELLTCHASIVGTSFLALTLGPSISQIVVTIIGLSPEEVTAPALTTSS